MSGEPSANFGDSASRPSAGQADGRNAFAGELPDAGGAVDGAFHARELELNVTEEEYKRYSPPAACLNPDTILRRISGGAEDCPAIKPGPDEEEVFSLPFLAVCGWAVVVLGVAGLYRFWGVWRLRRWVHRMRALGVMPNAPSPRRTAGRRSRRSSSRGKSPFRRYAG